MKRFNELFPMNDKTKLLSSAVVLGLLLLISMLLPLSFRDGMSVETKMDTLQIDKMLLFSKYWSQNQEDDFVITSPQNISNETRELCDTVMSTLVAQCVIDYDLDYDGPSGYEYTVVQDENGTVLNLCRMWLEAKGDWQNWMDVCFDSLDGTIYYLYVSRECLTNQHKYVDSQNTLNIDSVAEYFALNHGWAVRWVSSNQDSSSLAVVFQSNNGLVCYEVSCRVFEGLVDVRLCCR